MGRVDLNKDQFELEYKLVMNKLGVQAPENGINDEQMTNIVINI